MAEGTSKEVFLYKLEVILAEDKLMTIIVVANSDEKAFSYAENNLVRHTIAPPQIKEMSIVQKKVIERGGVGYVVETSQFD